MPKTDEPRALPDSHAKVVDTLVMLKFIPVLIVGGIVFLIYKRCCMKGVIQLPRQWGIYIEAAFFYGVWLLLAPLMTFYIKDLLTSEDLEFGYSFGFLGWSNFFTWVMAHILIQVAKLANSKASFGNSDPNVSISWGKGHILGILQALEVGLSAKVLQQVSVTVKTEVHMLVPLFQYVSGVVFGLEHIRLQLVFSIVVLAFGACLGMQGNFSFYDAHSGDHIMVCVAMSSSIFTVTRWTLIQFWLAPKGSMRPSALVLLCRMSPATAACGFLVAAFTEPDMYKNLFLLPNPSDVFIHLLVIGTLVAVMIFVESSAVQLTSALTLSVIMPLHSMSVILVDQITCSGTPLSKVAWAGVAISALATIAYTVIRRGSQQESSAECNTKGEPLLSSP